MMKNSLTLLAATLTVALAWLSPGLPQAGSSGEKKALDLCVQPAKGPIAASNPNQTAAPQAAPQLEIARVGRPAPDFQANAFAEGGFTPITLSDYKGQWVVLCFYPGDFTFV